MGSVGSLVFTGLSSYSSDFQSILDRANQIAQLPITKLQNEQSDNLGKKQTLIALNPTVDSLGSAITALGTVASTQGLSATSSDWTTVSVTNTGATTPGTYTISDVQSLASAAWATSIGFPDTDTTPVSTAGQNLVDLVVGTNTFHLDLTDNNTLQGLADAINNANAGVNAQILTTDSGNYLSISAQNAGETTIALNDVPAVGDPVSLLATTNSGSNADFLLNGTIHVVRASNTVNDIIPGLSFTLKDTTAGSVTLSLASDTSQLAGALQTFVNSYNALFDSSRTTNRKFGRIAERRHARQHHPDRHAAGRQLLEHRNQHPQPGRSRRDVRRHQWTPHLQPERLQQPLGQSDFGRL